MQHYLIAASVFACASFSMTASSQPPARRAGPPGPGYHAVTLPTAAGAGEGKETRTLIETPHLKLVTIVLRGGTVLATHSAPVAVTIQVLSGSGIVEFDSARESVSPGRMVVLAPNTRHAVRPDGTGDFVLLVHYLTARSSRAASDR